MEHNLAFEMAERKLNAGRYHQAAALYEIAIRITPVSDPQLAYLRVALYAGRAKAHLGAGRPERALAGLEQLVREDFRGTYQDYPEYWEVLAACHSALGQEAESAAAEREGRARTSANDWMGALERGDACMRQGKYAEAIEQYRISLSANPGEPGTISQCDWAERGIKVAQKRLGERG